MTLEYLQDRHASDEATDILDFCCAHAYNDDDDDAYDDANDDDDDIASRSCLAHVLSDIVCVLTRASLYITMASHSLWAINFPLFPPFSLSLYLRSSLPSTPPLLCAPVSCQIDAAPFNSLAAAWQAQWLLALSFSLSPSFSALYDCSISDRFFLHNPPTLSQKDTHTHIRAKSRPVDRSPVN